MLVCNLQTRQVISIFPSFTFCEAFKVRPSGFRYKRGVEPPLNAIKESERADAISRWRLAEKCSINFYSTITNYFSHHVTWYFPRVSSTMEIVLIISKWYLSYKEKNKVEYVGNKFQFFSYTETKVVNFFPTFSCQR